MCDGLNAETAVCSYVKNNSAIASASLDYNSHRSLSFSTCVYIIPSANVTLDIKKEILLYNISQ